MTLRKKGLASFSLTFDDFDAACDWVDEHEKRYYKDPEWYIKWREECYSRMMRSRQRLNNHILKPRFHRA